MVFFSAFLNEEFVTDHFPFVCSFFFFFFFFSFIIMACVTCLFEGYSCNKEKYARKWPLDSTRHQEFCFFKECGGLVIYSRLKCIGCCDLSCEVVKKKLYRFCGHAFPRIQFKLLMGGNCTKDLAALYLPISVSFLVVVIDSVIDDCTAYIKVERRMKKFPFNSFRFEK